MWDEGQYQILGVVPAAELAPANINPCSHPDDVHELHKAWAGFARGAKSYEAGFGSFAPMASCAGAPARPQQAPTSRPRHSCQRRDRGHYRT
jgi:hypothetical protein